MMTLTHIRSHHTLENDLWSLSASINHIPVTTYWGKAGGQNLHLFEKLGTKQSEARKKKNKDGEQYCQNDISRPTYSF